MSMRLRSSGQDVRSKSPLVKSLSTNRDVLLLGSIIREVMSRRAIGFPFWPLRMRRMLNCPGVIPCGFRSVLWRLIKLEAV